jgi:acetyl esterase/lipase
MHQALDNTIQMRCRINKRTVFRFLSGDPLKTSWGRIGRKYRESWFVVNKIYLFIVLIIFLVINSGLFLFGFIVSLLFFIRGIITAKIPIEPNESFYFRTYTYKQVGNAALRLDIWYPNQKKAVYPLVFFAHGGGWVSGFRKQPNNISWCKFLASKGFAAVSIDYRLAMRHNMKIISNDYTDALDFVKTNAELLKINRDSILLMGLSAGGHLALRYASYYTFINHETKMKGIKGVIAFYAPSDLSDIFDKDNKSIFARFATVATLKGSPKNNPDLYFYYSPIEWISERMVPTLLVHGKKDTVVPYISSRNLATEIKSKNITCKLLIHQEGGHGFETRRTDFHTIRILEETIRFMKSLTN